MLPIHIYNWNNRNFVIQLIWKIFTILTFCFIAAVGFAQNDAQLAQQYMGNGEYDKAADIYKNYLTKMRMLIIKHITIV